MENLMNDLLKFVVIPGIIILVLREVACWYFKINERMVLMKEQNKLLRDLMEAQQSKFSNYSGGIVTSSQKDEVETLRTMIKSDRNSEKIEKYLDSLRLTNDTSIDIIKRYNKKYNSNLVTDLTAIAGSEKKSESLLKHFIEFEIVYSNHPFNYIEKEKFV